MQLRASQVINMHIYSVKSVQVSLIYSHVTSFNVAVLASLKCKKSCWFASGL